jgi:hypothetical protein
MAPMVPLLDLDGAPRSLTDLRGQPTVVLFWDPGCGFCTSMLADLQAWEANRPEGAPQLLIVSGGDAAAGRAMGLTAPVVLDADFALRRAFDNYQTPTAVLVDAEGRIASELAVGAEAVLALVGAERVPSVV